MEQLSPGEIVQFWRKAGRDKWFKKDDEFDRTLKELYLSVHRQASAGAHDNWMDDAEGSLALILILDQFSRNMFRGSADAFAQDHRARTVADTAIRKGHDNQFDADMRCFLYLPFEHSESLADQDRSVSLVHGLSDADYLNYALLHRVIIRRFGRFPHRNTVLGRHTSPAEMAFLDEGGFSG